MEKPWVPAASVEELERPVSAFGVFVTVGDYLVKNAAGQIAVLRPWAFAERFPAEVPF